MTTSDWKAVRDVFERALEQSADARRAWLERTCGADAELRAAVDDLLAAHDESEGFLEPPSPTLVGTSIGQLANTPAPGDRIDRFRLVSVLGSGGMGTVYEAEQDSPRRRVALKVLDRNLGGDTDRRRFRDEADVLATLHHPAIAQVHASGTLRRSDVERLPWFAMELVEQAQPLTRHARDQALTRDERLLLFVSVCEAVHHAHQRGIVHRDLKPANVLVGRDGQPKVIDFGVARVLADDGHTGATRAGEIIGTLSCMSPEQLRADRAGVDTRTDVYALGALLYELLTDRPLFDFTSTPLPEALRLVCEAPVTPPSRLTPGLPRDLDWIVGRALEKEPERRYASASELAADIRRCLDDEPVLAGPPELSYRARKFVRRHRAAVAASVVVVLALVGALVGIGSALIETRASEQRAGQAAAREQLAAEDARAQRDVADDARQRADDARRQAEDALEAAESSRLRSEVSARKAEATVEFLLGLFNAIDPRGNRRDITVRDLLQIADEGLTAALPDDPDVEARLRYVFGHVYHRLGDNRRSMASLARAVKLHQQLPDVSLDERLQALRSLGNTLVELELLDQAEVVSRHVLELEADLPVSQQTLATHMLLGQLAMRRGRPLEYERQSRLMLDKARALGAQNEVLYALQGIASSLSGRQRFDEALPILQELVDESLGHWGADHQIPWLARRNLGETLATLGRPADAVPYYVEAVDGLSRLLSDAHPYTLRAIGELAQLHVEAQDFAAAEPLYARLARGWEQSPERDAAEHVRAATLWARSATQAGHLDQALAAAEAAQALVDGGALAPDDWRRAQVLGDRGLVLSRLGRFDEARLALEQGLALLDELVLDDAGRQARRAILTCLVEVAQRSGDDPAAERWSRELAR